MAKQKIEFSFCHRKPERSFFWRGHQFPVCARCTGIHIGYCSLPFFLFGLVEMGWFMSLLLIVPTVLDGLIQAFWNVESNNLRRFITGLAAGIGSMSICTLLGQLIGQFIISLF